MATLNLSPRESLLLKNVIAQWEQPFAPPGIEPRMWHALRSGHIAKYDLPLWRPSSGTLVEAGSMRSLRKIGKPSQRS